MSAEATYGRRLAILAARDAVVFAGTWWLIRSDAALHESAGALPLIVAVATGFMITVCGFYAHEWGHYLAGRFAGATPVPSPSPISLYLFELEEDACTRRQWLTMSVGGYAATILALPVILSVIDIGSLSGRVALVLTGLGVLATFALELPITYRVYRKAEAG